MSNLLAIAAVSAVLRNLLSSGLNNLDQSVLGSVAVTVLPPDRVMPENAPERSQLNLFMYHATTNPGWANVGLPSRDSTGQRLSNSPLALDLHYVLSVYGALELHGETLLGYAMQVLHENSVLTRAFINQTLNPPVGPPPADIVMLQASGLADQVELIKISPEPLGTEELSKLWTAFQARYRPTAVYRLSVVLIEGGGPTRTPLPVLTQGENDRGPQAFADIIPPYPAIEGMTLPNGQLAALIGDTLAIEGRRFAGDTGNPADVAVRADFHHPRYGVPPIVVAAQERTDETVPLKIADDAAYPAGVYTISLSIAPLGRPDKAQTTNEFPLLIGPKITTANMPIKVARVNVDPDTGLGDAVLDLSASPQIRSDQRATLVLGDQEIVAEPHAAPTNALTFKARSVAAGDYRVRLRVDGVESPLIDRRVKRLPKFDETQKITLT